MRPAFKTRTTARWRERGAWWTALAAGAAAAVVGVLAAVRERASRGGDARRTAQFDPMIWEAARRNGLSPFLIKAVILQESGFRSLARGRAGEVGLMQVTPGAIRDWERRTGFRLGSPGLAFDARLNIEIGAWYLAHAVAQWQSAQDPLVPALSQYNAGRRNALKWHAGNSHGVGLERVRFSSTHEYIRSVRNKYRSLESDFIRREHQTTNRFGPAQPPAG